MLSLILVVALVVWIVSRLRKKEHILSINFLKNLFIKDYSAGTILMLILVTYVGMITYINNYDSNIATINNYRDNISKLEIQIAEVDIQIEKISTNSELSEEEINTQIGILTAYKQNLEAQLSINARNWLPIQSPKRLKLYKFLLYFG